MSEAEMTLIMKLFDKSPLLVMCVFLYFGFVVPQRKKANEEAKPSAPAATVNTTVVEPYDDSRLVHSIEKLDDRIETIRQEVRADLATAKGEILEQVSRLDGIVTRAFLDDRRDSRKGH